MKKLANYHNRVAAILRIVLHTVFKCIPLTFLVREKLQANVYVIYIHMHYQLQYKHCIN